MDFDYMIGNLLIEMDDDTDTKKKKEAQNKRIAEYSKLLTENAGKGNDQMVEKTEEPQELALIDRLKGSNWVQKSDPLMMLRKIPFSLGELKVLDTYISRINTEDEKKRLVKFTKKEYEKLMGLQKLNTDSLRRNLNDLQDKKIKIDIKGQFVDINLFQLSGFILDHGELCILLECTDRARDLFFNLKHYTKYELKYILSLTSQYSYAFYLYVKRNSFRGTWTISVDELRDDVFGLENVETYKEFKFFNSKILKRSVKEINDLTDCFIEYEFIKKGRFVVAIKFSYKQNPKLNVDDIEGQLTITDFLDEDSPVEDPDERAARMEQFEEEMKEKYGEKLVEYARETDYIFEPDQIEVLHHLVYMINPPVDRLSGSTWYGYYSYLGTMYKRMLIAEKKSIKNRGKNIPNKFEYLVAMLEKELKKQQGGD